MRVRSVRKIPIMKSLDQVLESHRASVFSQNLKMLNKVLWRHAKQVRVQWQLNYPMVMQDEHPRCEPTPEPSDGALQPSNFMYPHDVTSGLTALTVIKTS